jgi:DNA-binding CsgD family transcriptional regulator
VLATGNAARDEQGADVLRAAAARAAARGAPHAAANYLRAVADGASEPDAALLHELALAEVRSHARDAPARVAAALNAAPDPGARAATAVRLGLAQFDAGAHEAAAATFGAGLEGAPDDIDAARTLRACLSAASGLGHTSGPAVGLEPVVERATAGMLTRAERLHLGHGAVASGFAGREIADTRRLARAALAGGAIDAGRASEMSAMILACVALVVADELDDAERALNQALDGAREVGSVTGYAAAAHIRAWVHYRRGRLADAIADAESVLDAARYGWEPALPSAAAVLVLCHLERTDVAAAEAALDLPGGEERWKSTFTWNDYLDARGRLHLNRGDAAAAQADFEAAGVALQAAGADHPSVVGWRSGAVRAFAARGDLETARRLANEDIERARTFGAPRALGIALRVAGGLAGGDRGIELLREADEVLGRSPARLEQAHAQTDLGAQLLNAGHRVAARDPLRAALDTADACGATALVDRARDLLGEAGARPRRRALSGRDSLTPRELRLAQMATTMTNREIAEALFITTKTVETHLRHAYDKLGISSRRELAAALGADSSDGSGASGTSNGPGRGSVRNGRNDATSTSGANHTT